MTVTKTSTIAHGSFTIARSYPQAPARVFAAFRDPVAKRRWFIEGEGWTIQGFESDFQPGGWERSRFRYGDGPQMTNDTLYHDIVENERMVFSYSMTMDGKPFSASLATIELAPEGQGTKLVYIENTAHLDGVDNTEDREAGCRDLLDALAKELARD